MEKAQFTTGRVDDAAIEPDSNTNTMSLDPGTFVEMRRNGIVTHGVVLFETVLNHKVTTMSLTMDGDLWPHLPADVFFAVPGFISANMAARCGWQRIAENAVQNNARVEVLRRIREIGIAVERLSHSINIPISGIYDQLKSSDPEGWVEVSLMQVVDMIETRQVSRMLKIFAVHKQLFSRPAHFVAVHQTYLTQQMFQLRPQAHISRLSTVGYIVRNHGKALDDFAAKARRIITASRERAAESWEEEPSLSTTPSHGLPSFNETDRLIIQVVLESLREARSVQEDPYAVPVAGILRKVGMYDAKVDDSLIHRLLVDLGVLSPWQDLTERALQLEAAGRGLSIAEPPKDEMIRRSLDAVALPGNAERALGPEDLYRVDPLDSLRHDFGDMPAYVIDDADAKELDDSISFEAIPTEPGSAWIHVHIADPTSILPPGHILARRAREQGSTVYFNHATWPMLPLALIENRLSLGSLQGRPQSVLSFSFKVDEKGALTEHRVRPGLVRNMIITQYDAVDKMLGLQTIPILYPFGQPELSPSPELCASLSLEHIHNLRSLYDVSRRLFKARLALPTFTFGNPSARVSLLTKPIPSGPTPDQWPASYRGFPSMAFSVHKPEHLEMGARSMVSEMMKAANRVASRFCLERNIPILRRACGQVLTFSDEDFARLLQSKNELGMADHREVVKVGASNPPSTFTTRPEEHWTLGVPAGEGYCWVTSPLRRYIDLLGHWQIKHAILHPDGGPLFETETLEEIGREQEVTLRRLRLKGRAHQLAWVALYLDRALHTPRKNENLAQGFASQDMVAYPISDMTRNIQSGSWACKAVVPALGLTGSLDVDNDQDSDVRLGEPIPVHIAGIKHGIRSSITFTRLT
ncbi:RNB-domain-containing protein [Punctularia strigosozonata HHB-11173 SS5]|uniref:RNB-domain-containing protein n=1 Tax=Punctularia strigosozonata (strain HHB-11173) TaxID=741275 RepID=UPI0004417965|nr:RNB-domain-containing protein [Punctularia strigosozonata HHB-11173 SS5]EIN09887.1 RNB-domain-containing protein [Punctularia strigosozonata HHB-11173 SS5]